MHQIHGKNFVEAIIWLTKLNDLPSQHFFAQKGMTHLLLINLSTELDHLHLSLSKKLVDKTIDLIDAYFVIDESQNIKMKMLQSKIEEIRNRIEDEIEDSVIICLNGVEANYALSLEPPFGNDVFEKFGSASSDLDEARKCMCFSRWTATVFHLMRALEVALTELGENIGATVKNKYGGYLTWGQIISNIDSAIEHLPKNDRRNSLSQARALLYHVNAAWRTDTMHPKNTYTEEEAKAAYEASGSFLRHLATLL